MNKMINEGFNIEVRPDQTIKGVILDALAKESPQVLETAYIYAKNYVEYGIDITKAWDTAVKQAEILRKVEMDSFYEGYRECRERMGLKQSIISVLKEEKSPCASCSSDPASCCGCPKWFEWQKKK